MNSDEIFHGKGIVAEKRNLCISNSTSARIQCLQLCQTISIRIQYSLICKKTRPIKLHETKWRIFKL